MTEAPNEEQPEEITGYVVVREEDNGSDEWYGPLESPVCMDVQEAVEYVVDYWIARIVEDLAGDFSGDILTPDEDEQLRREIRSQANQGRNVFDADDYAVLKRYSWCMILAIRPVTLSKNLVRKIQAMKSHGENH